MSASYDHTARIWNVSTGDCQAVLEGHSGKVLSAVFSPDGRHTVSASGDHTARIWNTVTGDCEAVLQGHSNWVISAVFSHDGRYIVSASYDCTARIWSTVTGDCQAVLEGSFGSVFSTVFSSHGVSLSHGFDGFIHHSLQPSFLDMYQDNIIHINNLQKIWIPPAFQNPSSISHHLSKICLAYGSGEILILKVSVIHK